MFCILEWAYIFIVWVYHSLKDFLHFPPKKILVSKFFSNLEKFLCRWINRAFWVTSIFLQKNNFSLTLSIIINRKVKLTVARNCQQKERGKFFKDSFSAGCLSEKQVSFANWNIIFLGKVDVEWKGIKKENESNDAEFSVCCKGALSEHEHHKKYMCGNGIFKQQQQQHRARDLRVVETFIYEMRIKTIDFSLHFWKTIVFRSIFHYRIGLNWKFLCLLLRLNVMLARSNENFHSFIRFFFSSSLICVFFMKHQLIQLSLTVHTAHSHFGFPISHTQHQASTQKQEFQFIMI